MDLSATVISCLATVLPFAERALCNACVAKERKFQFCLLAFGELHTQNTFCNTAKKQSPMFSGTGDASTDLPESQKLLDFCVAKCTFEVQDCADV